jgi:hypothetical protein
MCLTRSLVHGHLSATPCLSPIGDWSSHGGRLYTNTAPGLSVLAVPAAEAVRLSVPADGTVDLKLWAVRLATNGIALLLLAFLLGRIAEGLAAGSGALVAVTFALGTIASGVAPSSFGHLTAAGFAFGSFVLAWARRPGLAGLVAGLGIAVEYQTGLIALAVGAYALLSGRRAAAAFASGMVPGLSLLGAYDWAAFGSPFHLSYRYDPAQSQAGLFGVRLPSLHGIEQVFVGNRGLLVDSPVLIAAAAGLVLLGRSGYRAEAVLCSAVTFAFLFLDAGYSTAYGGDSPGPRFVVPALPFLALGLVPAYGRRRLLTTALATASVIASTAVLLTWPFAVNASGNYGASVWSKLPSLVVQGSSSELAGWFQTTVLGRIDIGRMGGAAVVALAAFTALGIAVRDMAARDTRGTVSGA